MLSVGFLYGWERVALSKGSQDRVSERARHKERDIASLRGGAPQTLRM